MNLISLPGLIVKFNEVDLLHSMYHVLCGGVSIAHCQLCGGTIIAYIGQNVSCIVWWCIHSCGGVSIAVSSPDDPL